MAEIIKFPGNPEDNPNREKKASNPMMRDGVFYDLIPPSNIQGKIFDHVQCEYQVPNSPDEYVVHGVPRGGTDIESFVLIPKQVPPLLRPTKIRGPEIWFSTVLISATASP